MTITTPDRMTTTGMTTGLPLPAGDRVELPPPAIGTGPLAHQIYIARQRIVTPDGDTFGYELLYRDGPDTRSFFDDPDEATQRVIERLLLHWGMERSIGGHFGLINASPSLIRSGLHRSMPAEGVLFELREDEPYDDDMVAALETARREGYHVAIENVTTVAQLERSNLFPLVSMVKVPVSTLSTTDAQRIVQFVRAHRPEVMLVAERIETAEQRSVVGEIGFDLFQGYFIDEPELMARPSRPADSTAAMALLALTGSTAAPRDEVDMEGLQLVVSTDPSLAYRVLAMVNSCAFGLDREVDSLDHALRLLGIAQIRHLATLLAVSATDAIDEALLERGVARARLAELVTGGGSAGRGGSLACLLSVTDSMYAGTLTELVADLPMSHDVTAGMLDEQGEIGEIIRIATACENADWDRLEASAPGRGDRLRVLHEQAVAWAQTVRHQVRTSL